MIPPRTQRVLLTGAAVVVLAVLGVLIGHRASELFGLVGGIIAVPLCMVLGMVLSGVFWEIHYRRRGETFDWWFFRVPYRAVVGLLRGRRR
jgi:hypothetical protein